MLVSLERRMVDQTNNQQVLQTRFRYIFQPRPHLKCIYQNYKSFFKADKCSFQATSATLFHM